jgi:hypothetical protein
MMLLLAPMMSSVGPKLRYLFVHCLSSPCDNLTQSEIGVLDECVVIMYDRSSSTNKVNDARLDLFARKQRPYNGIPP